MDAATKTERRAAPWNKRKLLKRKPPLKLKEIRAIRDLASPVVIAGVDGR